MTLHFMRSKLCTEQNKNIMSLALYESYQDQTNNKEIGVIEYFLDNNQCKIIFFFINSMYRDQGFGKLLLQELEKTLRTTNYKKIYVQSTTSAVGFYESQGYLRNPNPLTLYNFYEFEGSHYKDLLYHKSIENTVL